MTDKVDEFIDEWNGFLKGVAMAEDHWFKMKKLRETYLLRPDKFPERCQKIFSRVSFRSRFTVGIIRFLEYLEKYTTINECFIKVEKKEVDDG